MKKVIKASNKKIETKGGSVSKRFDIKKADGTIFSTFNKDIAEAVIKREDKIRKSNKK